MIDFERLRKRLLYAFFILVLIIASTTALTIGLLRSLSNHEEQITGVEHTFDHALADAAVAAKAAANDERGYLLTGNTEFLDEIAKLRDPMVYEALRLAMSLHPADTAANIVASRILVGYREWADARDAEFALFSTDPEAAMELALGPNRQLRKQYEEDLDAANAISLKVSSETEQAFSDELSAAKLLAVVAAISAIAAALGLATWVMRLTMLEHRQVTAKTQAEADSHQFHRQLSEALEISESIDSVYQVASRAFDIIAPGVPTELLIADSSEAHLEVAAESCSGSPGCSVNSLWTCPAIRRARTQHFRDANALNTCSHFRDRAAGTTSSAICVPVMFMGRALGVVHASNVDGAEPQDDALDKYGALAAETGTRLGVLKALHTTQRQASTDSLTGLSNRRALEDRANSLDRSGTPYVVGMGDLDKFKTINDTFGHDMGDRAIRRFGKVIREALRSNDMIARWGGDEFVVIFPEVDVDTAVAALERVREGLLLSADDERLPAFTASFGVFANTGDADFEHSLLAADQALLTAKRDGRNRVVVASRVEDPAHLALP